MFFSSLQQRKKVYLEIRQNVDVRNLCMKEAEKNDTFFVFDIGEWKVTSALSKTDGNLMKKNEDLLRELKQAAKKDFAVLVSSPAEAEIAARYAGFLYLPGEVCRQSDVLEACAKTLLPLVIEKGKFLAPNDMARLLDKIKGVEVAFVECGSSYGYSDVILDPRSLCLLKETGKYFGINLSSLLPDPEVGMYAHYPHWLKEMHSNVKSRSSLEEIFIMVGDAAGASFYVKKY